MDISEKQLRGSWQKVPDLSQKLTPLQVYTIYRVFLALILLLLSFLQTSLQTQTHHFNDQLYTATSITYFFLNLLAAFFIQTDTRDEQARSLLLITIDIIALTTLVHASGGIRSNLAILLVITVAAGNVLISGRKGTLVAAIATIAMIYEQFYFSISTSTSLEDFTPAGLLGISFFGVALIAQQLASRAKLSQQVAEEKTEQVIELQHLNDMIIQRMRTGILVVDEFGKIIQSNQAAEQLLDNNRLTGANLKGVATALIEQFDSWNNNALNPRQPFQANGHGPEVMANFATLSQGGSANTLIFIEDASLAARQAQAMKLASLGRFTASIAHEIRNPLSAISHASQLLNESGSINDQDSRLSNIIQQHSMRINSIIQNVLDLSRRQNAKLEPLELTSWIEEFEKEIQDAYEHDVRFENDWPGYDINIRFDPSQLYQVINNISDNGLRYSFQETGAYYLKFSARVIENSGLPVLEIMDCGPGVTAEHENSLFEPFFTTEVDGTGLGLYLCKELCESNQAHIEYEPAADGGSCFRIIFAHPEKLAGQ